MKCMHGQLWYSGVGGSSGGGGGSADSGDGMQYCNMDCVMAVVVVFLKQR